MPAIWGLITDLFGKMIAPILGFITQWRAERTARQLGRQEQRAADLTAGLKEAKDANQARGAVGGADADVDKLLTRPSRGSPAVPPAVAGPAPERERAAPREGITQNGNAANGLSQDSRSKEIGWLEALIARLLALFGKRAG